MKVKCIRNNNGRLFLTINRPYNVLESEKNHYHINDDNGEAGYFPKGIFEEIEEHKTYKGWEILKMLDESKLEIGQKIIREYKSNSEIFRVGKNISNGVKGLFKSGHLIGMNELSSGTFTIKPKEYMTFDEARKSGKEFKYKEWTNYNQIPGVLAILYTDYFPAAINKILDDKAWEVE